MKLKHILSILALFGAACAPGVAQEQKMPPPPLVGKAAGLPVDADLAEAEVRRVDKANLRITLRHGEIKSLDMPPMTMVFHVGNAALLSQVKVGDKIRFKAVNEAGKYTVTEIRPLS
ncbi:MAG: copper-binding protein [Burkholderiaceae bacterium]|nr:copper-binding protein [Burkholderiaceae bacterium]MDO9090491.1 copper-binding protein [Burkholderiaceae bacterium]